MLPNEIQKYCMRAKMAADLYGKGRKTDDVTVIHSSLLAMQQCDIVLDSDRKSNQVHRGEIVGFDDAFEVLNVDSGSKESNGIAKDWEPRTRPISWKDPVVREVRRNSKIIQSVCNDHFSTKMEICLALYDEDDQWYLALFLAYLKNGTVLVHYLDYGNVSKVIKKHVKSINIPSVRPSNLH
uniref:Tudor domain-containing protein n=1 Tax=Glossina palpalis gambiensis TaxID=67801 RepID=A0A1B0ANH8_9MUSC